MKLSLQKFNHTDPATGETDNYIGPSFRGFLAFPLIKTRDSNCLEESNFEYCKAVLLPLSKNGDVFVNRFGHWACGWYEMLLVNEKNQVAIECAEKILSKYSDYPVLDEDDFSDREWDSVTNRWAAFSDDEKKELCAEYNCTFKADGLLPNDDNGSLYEYLRT